MRREGDAQRRAGLRGIGGGSPVVFLPSSLSGLVLDIDAAAGLTHSGDGTDITAIVEQASGFTVTIAGGQEPTYIESDATFNGKPSMDFQADATLTITGDAGLDITASGMSQYVVVSIDAATGADNLTMRWSSPLIYLNQVATQWSPNVRNGANSASYAAPVNRTADGTPQVLGLRFVDGDLRSFSVVSGGETSAQDTSQTGYRTGLADMKVSNNQQLDGQIARILQYNRDLSDAEHAQLTAYLVSEYGL